MTKYELEISYDDCIQSPFDESDWELFSFSERHTNFVDPYGYLPPNIGLRRKLTCNTAFILSCY